MTALSKELVMAQLRLDFCVPRYVRARWVEGSSVGPSVQEPSIHPLPCPLSLSPEIAGWDGQPVQKASSPLFLPLQVQTNLGSTNKVSSVHPSAQWKLGSVAMDVRIGSIFRVWRSPSPLAPFECACFYGQYPTALIGAAKRFQADPETMQCNRRINAPSSPTDPR